MTEGGAPDETAAEREVRSLRERGLMFALTVRFDLLEGHETAFDRLVDDTLGHIRAEEPHTFAYLVNLVSDAPSSRVFVELYESESAFEVHEQSGYTQRFLREREQHLLHEPQVSFISTRAGFVREGIVVDGA